MVLLLIFPFFSVGPSLFLLSRCLNWFGLAALLSLLRQLIICFGVAALAEDEVLLFLICLVLPEFLLPVFLLSSVFSSVIVPVLLSTIDELKRSALGALVLTFFCAVFSDVIRSRMGVLGRFLFGPCTIILDLKSLEWKELLPSLLFVLLAW